MRCGESARAYRTSGYKIELFYFLANGWLERALAALQDHDKGQAWWGHSDWQRVAKPVGHALSVTP